MSLTSRNWIIRGTIHNANGSVFKNQGRILAYNLFPKKGWKWIAESDINSYTGYFELHFETTNFQENGSPEVEFPTLQIRVTDYEYNALWISDIYTNPPTQMNVGDIVINNGVNENWNVCGFVRDSNGALYTSGRVKVFDVRNGVERELGSYQLNGCGFYFVNYKKSQFQQGNTSITNPNLLVRVYSSDGTNVVSVAGPNVTSQFEIINAVVAVGSSGSSSGSGTGSSSDSGSSSSSGSGSGSSSSSGSDSGSGSSSGSDSDTGSSSGSGFDSGSSSSSGSGSVDNPDDTTNFKCKVYGTIKNSLGYPLQADIEVSAFCLYYQENISEDTSSEKTGSFVKVTLGSPVMPDKFGNYEISYDSSVIPDYLKLDSKIVNGKDKASLFAEVHYKKGKLNAKNGPHRFYSAPLVFNGQSVQEINFVLDLESTLKNKSEFEYLDEILKIYYKTIISGSAKESSDAGRISTDFETDDSAAVEGDNVSAENEANNASTDSSASSSIPQYCEHDLIAEFLCNVTQLPLVVGREKLDEQKVRAYFKAFQMAHEMHFVNVFEEEYIPTAAHYLYPLILDNKMTDMSTLLSLGIDKCKEYINAAIANDTIGSSSSDENLTLSAEKFKEEIWEKLQISKDVVSMQDDQFSDFTFFYLLLAKYYYFTNEKKPKFEWLKEIDLSDNNPVTLQSTCLSYLKNYMMHVYAGREYKDLIADLEEIGFSFTENVSNDDFIYSEAQLSTEDMDSLKLLTELCDVMFREKHSALLKAFINAGCNYRELIKNLDDKKLQFSFKLLDGTERVAYISKEDIEDLKLLVDLRDFCDECADLVVGTYNVAKTYNAFCFGDKKIRHLEDIVKYDHDEHDFWRYSVEQTSAHYLLWSGERPKSLPLDYFPGGNGDEQQEIAIRTLKKKLREKFSQKQLNAKIEAPYPYVAISDLDESSLSEDEIAELEDKNEWYDIIEMLRMWDGFDLNSSDLDTFLAASSITLSDSKKEKIRIVQRLYRLTDNPEAINYLIRNKMYSASQIALVDEERFVAEHGLGMGDKELATNIHRLAKSFVASATLDIERYHGSLNESGASILSIPRGLQDETAEDADNDANENAANPGGRGALLGTPLTSSNVAKQRLQSKNFANWKTLFRSLNRNPGTQNQSILSPSAYLLDLLEFLKQGFAFSRFVFRRPDILKLKMTKANAEVSLPTIDLAIELLESLVSKINLRYNTVIPFCNQTPEDATVEDLRANPCPWAANEIDDENEDENQNKISGDEIENAAMAALENKCYPMLLLKNFDRERASGILDNLSLDFVSLSRMVHEELSDEPDSENISILLNGYAPEYLSNDVSTCQKNVWDLWGLNYDGNENLFFPDKSRRVKENENQLPKPNEGMWFNVLSYLAFVLDRAQLTYDDFTEIFKSSVFVGSGVRVDVDSESYQLADVNGYRINFESDDENDKKSFFFKLSVFVRRRAALGWSIDEIARTWECSVSELATIQELKTRLELTAFEAALLLGKCSLTRNELEKLFPIEKLFSSYSEGAPEPEEETQLVYNQKLNKLCYRLAAAANVCLGMDPQDAVLILQKFGITENTSSQSEDEIPLYIVFENNLTVLYKYNLWLTKNGLSVEDYLFLQRIGFPVGFGDRVQCNKTINELEILRKSSLSVGDLKSIFEPELMSADEAIAFARELNSTVHESLKECEAQEKEKLSLVQETTGPSQPTDSSDEAETGNEIQTTGPAEGNESGSTTLVSTIECDYESAILGLLKTLGREDAEDIFDEWKNEFPSYANEFSETCLFELLKHAFEPSTSWKEDLKDAEQFYNTLCSELVAERTLALVAEKFSMTSDVVDELLKKLEFNGSSDFVEWINLALNDVTDSLPEILCNHLVRCAALYQYTQTLELGFAWDWNSLSATIDKYDSFKNVLYAFSASSQIFGEVYRYADLGFLKASDKEIQLPEDVLGALLDEVEINKIPVEGDDKKYIFDIEDPSVWCKFVDILLLYRKTNSLPADLKNLLQMAVSGEYSGYVDKLEENLKLVRTKSEWNKFIQGVHDKIRQSKRNALAAVVCHESQMPETCGYYPVAFIDENDIYSYYLFDVKMEPDMAISRTVQAVSCIQLYVQRALLGLEGDYTLNATQKEQWEWMKNYQVWVANRKVFLYPENWIDGDLREDKTPFFKELEDRLAEIGNDQEAMTEALGEYLKKVADTSEIDIVGACKQDGGVHAGTLYTLHIIGCTRGEPHTYYYRTYEATALYGGSWTPWEEVPVEIDGAAIQPAILGGHLYILWLQVVQGQRQKKTGDGESQQAVISVEYYAEIRLKWASYTGTKWTGVKVGKEAVYDISENQLDFILGENEVLANRYFIIDISTRTDALDFYVYRTFPKYEEEVRYVPILVANASSTQQQTENQVEGQTENQVENQAENQAKNPTSETFILKKEVTRTYDKFDQFISHIGSFSLTADGADTALSGNSMYGNRPIPFDEGTLLKELAPRHCRLVGNMFYSNTAELILLDGTELFKCARDYFKLLSVNMGFLCGVDRPFFYMDSQGTYLVRSVSGDGGAGANSVRKYYVEMVSNPQAQEFRRLFLQGGTKSLHCRETEALPISDSYYYSYSYYNYYFSVYLGYYTAGDWQAWDLSQTLFEHSFMPGSAVAEPYPSSMVDFSWGSASSIYNWELFFFVPMLLADRMLAEQNYAAALEWLQLVFDPRMDLSDYERTKRFVRDLPKGARYWKFLPFFANQDADKSILSDLSLPTPHDALPDKKAIQLLVERWKNDPFDPQLIARYRPVAYQKYVVMKYLDALIGWGDQLFTQDTTESVNLAIQMYILAADVLGPKSADVPGPKNKNAFNVSELLKYGNGVLNNAFVTYEDTVLSGKCREKETPQELLPGNTTLLAHTSGMMFYFNVPRNETLMGYWDTVADRLYKIRNSLNIEGVKRTLALFAPPIDPAMLVKAKANGVSISDALADASSALPYYRFKVMVAKAIEIVRDVMQMGRNLMDALEKYDAETLALLRVSHEKTMLALQKTVTDMDVTELEKELETVEIEQENIEAEQAEQEEYFKPLKLEEQYDKFMEKVRKVQETVENMKKAASVAYKIPDLDFGGILNGLGGPSFDTIALGGTKIAENLVNAAEGYASKFVQRQLSAAKMKLQGEAERALQKWTMEKTEKANQAKTVEKKIVTAEIKIDYAKKQVDKVEKEIELKDEMYELLSEKYTNKDLYTWLKKETGSVYKALFQLALKVARKAEKCYHFEIGDTDETPKNAKTFIKGSGVYWDGLRSGLLAGEKLLTDLHAMEVAYLENDKNEIEITRPVSLWELENRTDLYEDEKSVPKPLQNLKKDGCCVFSIPELLYKIDFPNQYFRRIRDVRIEVIVPDYSGHYLNAQLSLIENSLDLKSKNVPSIKNRIGVQNMATSTAHQETGKFDFVFSTDKYRPFEGAGAISKWSLTINGFQNTWDDKAGHSFSTGDIKDVIVHISYTARMGKEIGGDK